MTTHRHTPAATPSSSRLKARRALFTALLAAGLAGPVQAATAPSWITSGDGNWTDTANWSLAAKPVAGDTVTFGGTTAESIYLNGNQAAASLTFSNTGTTTLLGGVSGTPAINTLTLSGGITVNAGAGAVTIGNTGGTAAANLALSASQAFRNKTLNVITVNSGITSSAATGTQILTLNDSGANASNAGFTFNGVIGDGGSGRKLQIAINNSTASSVYTFNQTNTFSGGLRFGQSSGSTGQTLIAGADNAFGTGTTQLGDASGGSQTAQVQASGGARSFSNNWIVDAGGAGSNRMSFTGANGITISGTFNQNSRGFASSLSGGATLTLAGTVYISNTDVTGQTATLTGTGNTLISGVIQNNAPGTNTNASNYTFNNTGTTTLSAANTFSGVLTQSAGTLNLKHQNAVQSATFTKTAGTLVFDSSVAGNAFTFGGLSGGTNIALVNNAATPAGIALTVGGNNASTAYSGALTGTGGSLIKTGSGTLTLSGANTYTGATTISAGTLAIAASERIANTSNLILGGGTLALGGFTETLGTLQLTANSGLDLGSGGKAIFADSSAVSWTGGTTLSVTGTFVSGSSLKFGNSSGGLLDSQWGQISIAGYTLTGLNASGFLLGTASAVPEPATYAALAGLGILGFAAYRRRRAS